MRWLILNVRPTLGRRPVDHVRFVPISNFFTATELEDRCDKLTIKIIINIRKMSIRHFGLPFCAIVLPAAIGSYTVALLSVPEVVQRKLTKAIQPGRVIKYRNYLKADIGTEQRCFLGVVVYAHACSRLVVVGGNKKHIEVGFCLYFD